MVLDRTGKSTPLSVQGVVPHLHRQVRNRIPNARLVQMSGAGHLVAAELSPRFNALVSRFLLEYDS